MKKYEVFVIGAGPGGYSMAIRLKEMGYKVAIAEKEQIGGTCLNCGCIPTKFYLQKAKECKINKIRLNDSILCEWKSEKDSMLYTMRSNMEAVLKNNAIEFYRGNAEVRKTHDGTFTVHIGSDEYIASKVVIATGSVENFPPIGGLLEGFQSGFVVGSKQMLDNDEMLEKIVIIGGGIIGFEFASFWNTLGCEVVILEKESTVLPQVDEDVRKQYVRNMEKKGVVIYTDADVWDIDDNERSVSFAHNKHNKMLECDKVLVATGRRVILPHGISEEEPASLDLLYLIGDCNGKLALAHAAYEESKVLANQLKGIKDSVCYDLVPRIIYSDPELAWVGKSEQCCAQEGIVYDCYKKSMSYSSKYYIENKNEQGMCKLVFDKATQKMLGAQLMGNGSCELISFIKLSIEMGMTKEQLRRFTFPHPSIAEIIYETIG